MEEGKQLILNERASNRVETNKLRGDRSDLEVKRAKVNRDREIVVQKMQELLTREEESKRNRHVCNIITPKFWHPLTVVNPYRTTSQVFIEDRFLVLGAKEVLEYLTSVYFLLFPPQSSLIEICGHCQSFQF